MTPFEIVLIIIGIACIVISCLLLENKKEETIQTEYGDFTEQMLIRKMKEASDEMDGEISKMKETNIVSADEMLSKVSNEKIMAVHEFSDQVLKEIDKNHQEVVFLYQMLTEKEKELKQTSQEMIKTKREVERFLSMSKEELEEDVDHQIRKKEHEITVSKDQVETQTDQIKKDTSSRDYQQAMDEIVSEEYSNHIQEIMELAEQGKSVVEISKQLGLGQGEVKLVIDFQKRQ